MICKISVVVDLSNTCGYQCNSNCCLKDSFTVFSSVSCAHVNNEGSWEQTVNDEAACIVSCDSFMLCAHDHESRVVMARAIKLYRLYREIITECKYIQWLMVKIYKPEILSKMGLDFMKRLRSITLMSELLCNLH